MSAANDFAALGGLYPRVLARTLGVTRSLPDAEDAVQEAIARALEHWPESGAPEKPEAWLVTVAANAHRDRVRRGSREELRADAIESLSEMSPWVRSAIVEREVVRAWKDELLGLLFACCHPSLAEGESAALALATVIGLSNQEIARAFMLAPRSLEQRLTRARKRLREVGEFEHVGPEHASDRMGAVLRVLHLLFNEGYWSSDEEVPIRSELCRLAIGLARSLHDVYPGEPEVAGLLALFQLHEARRPARLDAEGEPVPLPEQDRSRWDRAAIDCASALLVQALEKGAPGPFQIEASISAVHSRAEAPEDTDWSEIAALYAMLERFRPISVVRVNRAFAVGQALSASAGLALLEDDDGIAGPRDAYFDLVRAVLLTDSGQIDEARRHFAKARARARNPHERRQIERRVQQLDEVIQQAGS